MDVYAHTCTQTNRIMQQLPVGARGFVTGLVKQVDRHLVESWSLAQVQTDTSATFLGTFSSIAHCEQACLDTVTGRARESRIYSKITVVAGLAGVTINRKGRAAGQPVTDAPCLAFTFFAPAEHGELAHLDGHCYARFGRAQSNAQRIEPRALPARRDAQGVTSGFVSEVTRLQVALATARRAWRSLVTNPFAEWSSMY